MSDNKQLIENITLLTVKETSLLFKVSTYTIKRWIKSGQLDGIRLPGNQWRIPLESCNLLIKMDK